MGISAPFRKFYIRTTNFTHGLQGDQSRLNGFYRLWSMTYDISVALDPAFRREMKTMISRTVRTGDHTLDIGCGTGISTLAAARIAARVTGIDPSTDMLEKLQAKVRRRNVTNIETISGPFPEALPPGLSFDSVISSFAIVHFKPAQRPAVYEKIWQVLDEGGRLGLFSAQGEVASSFETRNELEENLGAAGFRNIRISDVSDIYRIVQAEKPR